VTTRREAAAAITLSAVGFAAARLYPQTTAAAQPAFSLPPLPYPYDALEPYIDAQTLQIHHDRHHAAYVDNLNKALANNPELGRKSVEDLLRDLNSVPESIRTAVRNHGGGHANHTLYWQVMSKSGAREPAGELAKAIDSRFGSFSSFQDQLTRAATGLFGSGWAWLSVDKNKQLAIIPTSNQDTPLALGHTPLVALDVWEHAYYLKYQNRRADYVAAFHKVINWDLVSERYSRLLK
jgi:Fe-Mn family superoxide dismutase